MTESNRDTQGQGKGRDAWNHRGTVVFSPLFDWPPNPKPFLLTLTKRWLTLSRNALFLIVAWLVYRYFLTDLSTMRLLSIEWALPIFHRNLRLMTVVAGGLHSYLFTYRTQGKWLKYDAREQLEKSGNFSFRNQSETTCFGR